MESDDDRGIDDVKLAADHRSAWQELGWLHLPAALGSETVAQLDEWADEVSRWADDGGPGLHHFEQTDNGPATARSERFTDDHAPLRDFVRNGLVAELVGELFGESAVLFKEKINYKRPGGAGFAPHQDAVAYRFVDHHVSALVPIDAATTASGCLWFAPGHDEGRMATDERGRIEEVVVPLLDWRPVEVVPGDVVLFDSYAPHYSETNHTERSRRTLYLTFNAASRGDHRAVYYADKEAEFARAGETFTDERVRLSISDDFLGRPVEGP